MKFKLYNFINHEKLKYIKNPEVLSQFEIINDEIESLDELLTKKYDVIEIDSSRYADYSGILRAVDWRTNNITTADCLIYKGNSYKPYNILADTLLSILKKNVDLVNSQLPVIVIGDIYFVNSVVTKLAISGFVEIVVSLVDADLEQVLQFESRLKSFVFNLNLKIIPIGDLTSTEQSAYLMISNFQKDKNKESYELLSYFNFLTEGATFIDCNSLKDSFLVEDARKAEIRVIDEIEVIENKYNYLLELLKISS